VPEWGSVRAGAVSAVSLVWRSCNREAVRTVKRYRYSPPRAPQDWVNPGLGDWHDWTPEKGHVGPRSSPENCLTASSPH
jgi:hypothetical protein